MASWAPDEELDPVPEPLRRVLDVVLPDFQQPAPIEVLFGFDPVTRLLCAREPGVVGRTCFWFSQTFHFGWLVVDFADQLQDQFFPESAGAWGEARPACPGHRHPAQAETVDGEAVWVCPKDRRTIARVGQYGR